MKKLKRFVINHLHGYHLEDLPKIKELQIEPMDKICILAPHADDEVIGCGGLLAKYGKQCDVVLLTDGSPKGDEEIRQKREEEFLEVMAFMGVSKTYFMRARDGRLVESYDLFKKIDFSSYKYVFMPHPLDSHKDHVVPQAFFRRLKKEQHLEAQAIYYEVWGAMAKPTHFINIGDVVEKKREAIKMYQSQSNIDYADRILALNHYRGIRHFVDYEEDYCMEEK